MRVWIRFGLGIVFCAWLAATAMRGVSAAVDLVTVPERRAVTLTIYNSADLTMVSDRRRLTFKEGANVLQFAWAGTLIDPSSLEIHFRGHEDELDLVDTVFPPDRGEALQWNVNSRFNGDAEVEITYFTSGLTWQAAYVAHLTAADTRMQLLGDVKVTNFSGEDYPNASVRLIVGTVNLLDDIAQLARQRGGWDKMPADDLKKRNDQMRKSAGKAERALKDAGEGAAGGMEALQEARGIVKEGLSEYFLFAIEGTETIPNGWSKSINSIHVADVPVEVTFRGKDVWGDGQLHRFLRFDNRDVNGKKDKTNLGLSPLPDGAVHFFRRYENQDLSFLARLRMPYVAMKDKCELDTGAQPEVGMESVLLDYRRDNIVFDSTDRNAKLVSYDEFRVFRTTLRNSLPFPVLVEIERTFPSTEATVLNLEFKMDKVNATTFRIYPKLDAAQEKVFEFTVKTHIGK